MRFIKYLIVFLVGFLLISCSKVADPVKKIGLGTRVIDYQDDESVDSLVIPPDLTKPNSKSMFSKTVDMPSDIEIISKAKNVEVKRDNYRRWLVIDKPSSEVWTLSRDFFRSYGFKIEKENQKIGIFETDYLEIETQVPEKSLGAIRAGLSKILKTQYGLPIADKYRIRIEPTEDPNKSEVYLTLSSIGEVVNGSMRVWQPRDKDVELETEMLLTLMVFIGSDRSEAISQLESNNENLANASVILNENGYPILVFPYDKKQSWSFLGWALDELDIDIDDRDSIAASYFINVAPNKGLFSKFFISASSVRTFQLFVKEIDKTRTEVMFIDISEDYDQDTINYSIELFNQIASKF